MKLKLTISCVFILLFLSAKGQLNIDSTFRVAIEYSKQKEYVKAIEISEYILSVDSSRYDIKIFLANIFAWQKDYAKATEIVEQVYNQHGKSSSLFDSWLNILLWDEEYEKLVELVELAKREGYENEYNLSLKHIIAFKELGLYDEAIELVDEQASIKDSSQVRNIYNELIKLKQKNTVSLYVRTDFIPADDFEYFGFIDYSRRLGKNNIIARFNYVNRFNNYDFLPEIDYYQTVSARSYMYFNLGFGLRKQLYPKQRAGIEYFTAIKSWGLSLGGRFLNFNNDPVYIITSEIEKNFSRASISLRPYYSIQNSKDALTLTAKYKIYWDNPENYSAIQLAYGNSPDESYFGLQQDISLENYWIKLESNVQLTASNSLNVFVRYMYEETTSNSFRNRFSIEILFKQRF